MYRTTLLTAHQLVYVNISNRFGRHLSSTEYEILIPFNICFFSSVSISVAATQEVYLLTYHATKARFGATKCKNKNALSTPTLRALDPDTQTGSSRHLLLEAVPQKNAHKRNGSGG